MRTMRAKRLSIYVIAVLVLGACWGGIASLQPPVGLLLLGFATTSFAVQWLLSAALKRLDGFAPSSGRHEDPGNRVL